MKLPLARPLYATLRRGTIVLGDALFGSYADFWLLGYHRLDGLFQLHGARKTDFRRGQRLGKNDHLVTWTKQRSQGVAVALYAQLAPTQIVRELRYTIQRPGYRARTITLVTSRLDPLAYPPHELGPLFGLRWHVELDLRHLKTTMQMECLRTKTPQMVLLTRVITRSTARDARSMQKAIKTSSADRITAIKRPILKASSDPKSRTCQTIQRP